MGPDLNALLFFLRVEIQGTVICQEKNYFRKKYRREVYEMSDVLTYAVYDEMHLFIILD